MRAGREGHNLVQASNRFADTLSNFDGAPQDLLTSAFQILLPDLLANGNFRISFGQQRAEFIAAHGASFFDPPPFAPPGVSFGLSGLPPTMTLVRGYRARRLQGYRATGLQGYRAARIHGDTATRLHGYTAAASSIAHARCSRFFSLFDVHDTFPKLIFLVYSDFCEKS